MIDLSPFLTPPPRPPLAPVGSGAQALGDYAEFAAKEDQDQANLALRQRQQVEVERNNAAQNATQALHAASAAKYYDAQAVTHRMAVEQQQRKDQQAQRAKLLTDIRKEKDPSRRRMLLDQAKLAGLNYTEEASALTPPEATNAGVTGAATGAPPGAAPTESTMQFYGGQNEPIDAGPNFALQEGIRKSVEGTPAAAPGTEEPFPWDLVGMQPPAPAAALTAPTAPAGHGKHILTDATTGERVLEFDEPVEKAKVEQEMMAALAPAGTGGLTPESQKAAKTASEMAAKLYDATGNKEFAIKQAADWLKSEMGQFRDRFAGGGGGGGGIAPTKAEMKLDAEDRQTVNQIITRVQSGYDFKGTTQAIKFGQGALAHLDAAAQGGMQQLAALKDYMLQKSGKVVTDKEMNQFLGSTGGWTKFQMAINRWTAGGEMPPEFLRQLRGVFQTAMDESALERKSAGDTAYEEAIGSGLNPRLADVARGHFTGDFQGESAGPARRGKPTAGGGAGKAAPSAGGMSADEKRKKLLEMVQ